MIWHMTPAATRLLLPHHNPPLLNLNNPPLLLPLLFHISYYLIYTHIAVTFSSLSSLFYLAFRLSVVTNTGLGLFATMTPLPCSPPLSPACYSSLLFSFFVCASPQRTEGYQSGSVVSV